MSIQVTQSEIFANQGEGNLVVGAVTGAHEHVPVTKTHRAEVSGETSQAAAALKLKTGKP